MEVFLGKTTQKTLVEKISGPCITQTKNWTETQIAKKLQGFIEREKKVSRRIYQEAAVGPGQMAQEC